MCLRLKVGSLVGDERVFGAQDSPCHGQSTQDSQRLLV